MLPTPPVAPVTATGPSLGLAPNFSSFWMHRAAVKPPVPYVMASLRFRVGGQGTAQLAGIDIIWPRPPAVFMPKS